MRNFVECSILRGTPAAVYTTCILSDLGNALNSCQFNSRFISFTVITSTGTHCMPAPHTICYNGQLYRWVHHQPSCTEWTACIYHIMCPTDARHAVLHKQARHCSRGHSLACCCNWRRYTASVEHSMLNQWLGSLGRASLQRVSPL